MLLNVILNLTTVFLICSIVKKLSVFFITFFGLVILNCEILSLFQGFSEKNILILSFIELLCVFIYFFGTKKKLYFPLKSFKEEFLKIKNALKVDKSLTFLLFGFILMLLAYFILAFFSPVLEPDSRMYHFARVLMYVKQGSFAHFSTNEIRNTVFPFNSEMFYSYFYIFKKNDVGFGFLSYFSFINAILMIYLTFLKLKIPRRKAFFGIFVFSALPLVLVQITSLQTDIVVASFYLSAIYLFISGSFHNKKSELYFSSLAIALTIGVKSTGLLLLPIYTGIILSYLFLFKINNKFLILKRYLIFFVLNFLVFSSYNYILNFVEWKNFIAPISFLAEHGVENYFENVIYLAVDFLGFFKPKGIYDERTTGFLLLGIAAILPAICLSLFKLKSKNKREKFIAFLGASFIVNFFALAFSMKYFPWSIRFFTAYAAISCFSVVFLYKNKFLKNLIVFLAFINLVSYSFFSTRSPLYFFAGENLKDIRPLKENIILNKQQNKNIKKEYEIYKAFLKTFKKTDKIAILNDDCFYELKNLIDFDLYFITSDELYENDFSDFDFIILKKPEQISNNLQNEKNIVNEEDYYCGYIYKEFKGEEVPYAKKCFFSNKIILKKGFLQYSTDVSDGLFEIYKKSGRNI